MQTEELVRRGGLVSGLEAKGRLNQLLDEFYGNRLKEEKAPQGKRTGALVREATQHFFVVPPGLERAAKKKETLQQPAPR